MKGKQIRNRPFNILSSVIHSIIDLIYPPYCIVCGSYLKNNERLICENCWYQLPRIGSNFDILNDIGLNLRDTIYFSKVISIWEFSPPIQTVIHALKYQGFKILANRIGFFMADRLKEISLPFERTILIPVPLHKTRIRERGYNQSALLCEVIASETGLSYHDKILTRIRYTQSQTKLNAIERTKNVENAFQVFCSEEIKSKLIILVDDVITTGATMNACAKELIANGAEEVFLFSAAKA